jgi:hypothetical protein
MSSVEPPPNSNNTPGDKGLPPVMAPSGRHIVQLFLVPGIITAGAVAILLGFSWLAGGARTPRQFLTNLDTTNADIRWRAANDLAQVLTRDEQLAAEPAFGLSLAVRLHAALEELDRSENDLATLPPTASVKEQADARKRFIAQRNYVHYLMASVGNLSLPVGAQLLGDLARDGRGKDPKLTAHIRRRAVWALSNLGHQVTRFDRLSDEQKGQIRDGLTSLSEGKSLLTDGSSLPEIARGWARDTHSYLNDGKSLGVVAALAACARADDPFLREQVAHSLNFWGRKGDEKAIAEQTLLMLARDAGRGERIEVDTDE